MIFLALALARPTDGTGLWTFAEDDVVATLDDPTGVIRVWYSSAGTNVVKEGDADANGLPDFAEQVAVTAADVLAFYASMGFRAPLPDDLGGSDAMDVYLVDFGGSADGAYSPEDCTTRGAIQCSGYFLMENDFRGYGYSDLPVAIAVLTSHELFHAVQAAYDSSEEVWWSEGTAVWAEWAYDHDSEDFLAFASAYLDDTGRSLDQPPSGPVPTFAYATALWWWFLANRYGDGIVVDLLEATEAGDTLLVDMEALEESGGGSLRGDWTTFTQWNLATGGKAGATESYPFAEALGGIHNEAHGDAIIDDNRYYPLAATYYRLDHDGDPLFFALAEEAPELAFSLHPTDAEGRVLDAIALWDGGPQEFGALPAGEYWLIGSNPTLAEDSTKVLTCLGDAEAVAACAPADTGTDDTGTDGDDTGTDGGDTAGDNEQGRGDKAATGCGCGTVGSPNWAWAALAGLATVRRRR